MNAAAASPKSRVDVAKILRRHRPFMLAAAFALSLLIAEEAWMVAQFFPRGSELQRVSFGVGVGVIVLAGNLLAFFVPLALARPEKSPSARPVGAFAEAMAQGIIITVLTYASAYVLLLILAGFELTAAYVLLKDIYFYALVTVVLFHGLLYYVRHMHWLYEEFGAADSPLKPIAASGGIGALIFVVTIVFLPLDLQGIQNAPAAQQGLASLYLYARDLYLLTLALGAYAWHLRWIADH